MLDHPARSDLPRFRVNSGEDRLPARAAIIAIGSLSILSWMLVVSLGGAIRSLF